MRSVMSKIDSSLFDPSISTEYAEAATAGGHDIIMFI